MSLNGHFVQREAKFQSDTGASPLHALTGKINTCHIINADPGAVVIDAGATGVHSLRRNQQQAEGNSLAHTLITESDGEKRSC